MVDSWVLTEMETVDLQDKRLDRRWREVLSQWGELVCVADREADI